MTSLTTASDTFVPIESIRVVDRHRKDLGDLDSLRDSIEAVGLLNPVTLTRDLRLVAGQRRIEACRRLGWQFIPARFVDSLHDAVLALRAELEENTERKAMLPSELASLGATLAAIQAEHGREAQRVAGRENGRGIASGADSGSYRQGETREVVGSALGMSGRTYDFLAAAHTAANHTDPSVAELGREALGEMDRSGAIWPAGRKLERQLRAKREAEEVKAAALDDPKPEPESGDLWVPPPRGSGPRDVAQRRHLIRHYGAKGYTSQQLADMLGISDESVRRIARVEGITIQADIALGRNTRKGIDSTRIVRETVATLDALRSGINLVDFDDLDDTQIGDWVQSLSESIAALNRLKKQLKERTQ